MSDLISRQAVLDKLNEWEWQELYLPIHFKENIIDVLPSVTPTERTGHWEWVQYDENPEIGNFHCSECRYIPAIFNMSAQKLNYCPKCGVRMVGDADE